jgi:hypothetical protein
MIAILVIAILVILILFNSKITECFKDYKYTAVIIEPREHPALEYVLKNFNDNLSNEWRFVIFHGNNNINYTQTICSGVFDEGRYKLVNLNVDNLTLSEYSGLFYNDILYDNIPTEVFLIFQTDSIICSQHKELINNYLQYDYVGAPWENKKVGNGGLSLRRKSKMKEIVDKCKNTKTQGGYINEDIIFAYGCDGLVPLNKPSFEDAKSFSIETVDNDTSFGIHKAYAYLDSNKIGEWCPAIFELEKLNS